MSGGRGWRPRGRNRKLPAVSVALCAIGTLGLLASPAPAAEEPRAFSATATASGVRLTISVTDLAISEAVDAGGPVTQAQLESSGLSRGFASIPYPGDTVISAPGLVYAATQGTPAEPVIADKVPSYPLYASADYPGVPESKVSDPENQLIMQAKATQDSAQALARIFPGAAGAPETDVSASGARSLTVVTKSADGTVTSFAETVVEGIAAQGIFSIASVRSVSKTVLRPDDEKPTTTTTLAIDGALVAGLRVGFGPEGLVLANQVIPVPVGDTTKQLNDALKDRGMSIRVLEGQELTGGRTSDVLEIVAKFASPATNVPGGTVRYRIGGASSFILTGAAFGIPPLPTGGETALPPPAAPVVPPTSVLDGTTAPPAATPQQPVPTRPTAIARDMRDAIKVFYLILGVGAALGLASSGLWRKRGGLVPWTS